MIPPLSSDLAPLGWSLEHRLEGPGSATLHVSWSPRGDRVAASFEDGSVWVWNLERDEPCQCPEILPEPASQLAWSPDGEVLALGLRSGTIFRWALQTGTLVPLEIAGSQVVAFSWTSSGRDLVACLRKGEYPRSRSRVGGEGSPLPSPPSAPWSPSSPSIQACRSSPPTTI